MRVVLDTNVVVSSILFRLGRLAWLRNDWTDGSLTPLVDKPCVEELLRVLTYRKFRLDPNEIETLLGNYLPYTKTVEATLTDLDPLPHCRDPQDQKFLILAQAGNADVLITGDKALLELAGQTDFLIEAPGNFKRRLQRRDV